MGYKIIFYHIAYNHQSREGLIEESYNNRGQERKSLHDANINGNSNQQQTAEASVGIGTAKSSFQAERCKRWREVYENFKRQDLENLQNQQVSTLGSSDHMQRAI
jgi:hypothetical protein